MRRVFAATVWSLAALAFGSFAPTPARADLTLQASYASAGFSLGTLAFNFAGSPTPAPYSCCGPLGMAFPTTGGVMISTYPGSNYILPSYSTLNQDASLVPSSFVGAGQVVGLARSGGQIYAASQSTGQIYRINNDGSYASTLSSGLPSATSLATNPANGHLFSGTGVGIVDINPADGSFTLFANTIVDGITFSADGSRMYAASGSNIIGYNTATATSFLSFSVPDGPDGVAIGSGSLAGKLYINNNGGTFYEYDLTTAALTLMASGGTRGDFVEVAPDGALLITQTDRVLRLTAPSGGGFETTNTPEPASLAIFGAAIAGLAGLRRRVRT